jgi:integrase
MARGYFYRTFDGWWYAQLTIDGRRVQRKLVKGEENETKAEEEYIRLRAELLRDAPAPVQASAVSAAEVIDRFLDHSQANHKPATFQNYAIYLVPFAKAHGRLRSGDLKPLHATHWMDTKSMKRGARRAFVTAIKRAFSWAEEQGLIAQSPVQRLKKPKGRRRHRTVTEAERQEILGAIRDQRFRDFVFAMQETGCRPGEVAKVTADDVDLDRGLWVLGRHKTEEKTGEARIVYLTPAMVELSRRLMDRHPDGPLFRGWGGKPYSVNAIRCRFRRLREKLPHLRGVVAYCYRHTFASNALERGVGIAQVAELLGHRSTDMVMRHYSHLRDRQSHLRAAAAKAAGTNPG